MLPQCRMAAIRRSSDEIVVESKPIVTYKILCRETKRVCQP